MKKDTRERSKGVVSPFPGAKINHSTAMNKCNHAVLSSAFNDACNDIDGVFLMHSIYDNLMW